MSNPPAYPIVYCSTSWQRLIQMSGCNTGMHIHNAATSYTGKSLPSSSAVPAMTLSHSSVGTFVVDRAHHGQSDQSDTFQSSLRHFLFIQLTEPNPIIHSLWTRFDRYLSLHTKNTLKDLLLSSSIQSSPCRTFATHKKSQFTFHPSIVDTIMI